MAHRGNRTISVVLIYQEWMGVLRAFALVHEPDDICQVDWAMEEAERQEIEHKIMQQIASPEPRQTEECDPQDTPRLSRREP
jgi:hypothetical protein